MQSGLRTQGRRLCSAVKPVADNEHVSSDKASGGMAQQEKYLPTRAISGTVTFARPFFLRRIDRELPAGSYAVETEEEALGGGSALSYRRIEVRLFVPPIAGISNAEMWVVSPGELDAALALDRQPASRREADIRGAVEAIAPAVRTVEVLQLRNRDTLQDKGSNTPLYGTLLGILALLAATAIAGRQDPAGNPPPARTAQGPDVG
jgi:hypothetical protein